VPKAIATVDASTPATMEEVAERLDSAMKKVVANRGAPSAWGTARDDYARPVAYAFDPRQPGARKLLELARQRKREDVPTRVEVVAPLLWAEENRPLHRGAQVALPAGLARRLIDGGLARPAE